MFPQPFPNAAAFPVPASFQLQQPWIEYATPEGRKYYFNTVTKVSQWEKPANFVSPAEMVFFFFVTLIYFRSPIKPLVDCF